MLTKTDLKLLISLLAACCSQAVGQDVFKARPAIFLSANDRLAFDLLRATHSDFQNRNKVISPLPISLSFAAIWPAGVDSAASDEIRTVFHWEHVPGLHGAAKMLLARFEKPKPRPTALARRPVGMPEGVWRELQSSPQEEAWLTASFLCRAPDALDQQFIHSVARSKPEKHDFHLRSEPASRTDFLLSELTLFPHALTPEFEAVQLPGVTASILFVLPSARSSIEDSRPRWP